MDAMSDEPMIAVLQHFFEIANDYDLEDKIALRSAPLAYLKQFSTLDKNPADVLKMKSITDDSYQSLTDIYKDLTGIYSFDFVNERWNKKSSLTEIRFEFPSTKIKTTNDAVLRIFDYAAAEAQSQDIENWTYELLTSLKMELTVGTTTEFSSAMTATYNTDDAPKFMQTTVDMTEYSWTNTLDMTTPSSKMSASSSYKHNDDVIMEFGINATGNFTYDNLQKDLEAIDNDDIYNAANNQDILKTATISFRIENLKLEGTADAVKLIAGITKAEEIYDAGELDNNYNYIYDEKAYTDAKVKALNDNISLQLFYVNSQEVIASLELYTSEYEDWNGNSTTTGYEPMAKFIFSDGSSIDESYFENGFSSLFDRINEMVRKVNRQYDAEFEEI